MFVLGGELLKGLGARQGVAAFFFAGVLLAALASVTGFTGAKTRLSTYSIIIAPFGAIGAKALTALLSTVAIGWFGVTVGFFGEAVDVTLREIAGVECPAWFYTLAGGALMTGAVLFGFKGIDLLNRIAVPLLVLVLIWSAITLLGQSSLEELMRTQGRADASIHSFELGVSAVLGIVAGLAGGMPDLMRLSPRNAQLQRDLYGGCLMALPANRTDLKPGRGATLAVADDRVRASDRGASISLHD